MVTEPGTFVRTQFTKPYLDLNLDFYSRPISGPHKTIYLKIAVDITGFYYQDLLKLRKNCFILKKYVTLKVLALMVQFHIIQHFEISEYSKIIDLQ